MGAAKIEGVPWDIVTGVAYTESRFRPSAVSSAGARGLMQLMPATGDAMAKAVGLKNPDWFNAYDSARMGARYLKLLIKRFKGKPLSWAVASYYTGAGPTLKNNGPNEGGMKYARFAVRAANAARASRARCEGADVPTPHWPGQASGTRPHPSREPSREPSRPTPAPAPSSSSAWPAVAAMILGLGVAAALTQEAQHE